MRGACGSLIDLVLDGEDVFGANLVTISWVIGTFGEIERSRGVLQYHRR
jgi:hypothetical protein